MAIKTGNNSIVGVYAGTTPIVAVFCGSTKIYESGSLPTVPVNEIWYKTDNEQVIAPYTTAGYGSDITLTENVYEGGYGKLKFSGTVTAIPSNAFLQRAYRYIYLPSTVTSLGSRAFQAGGLKEIFIPKSVTNISTYTFVAQTYLNKIVIEEGNPNYDSRDNCNAVCTKTMNVLQNGCNGSTIPNTIYRIGNGAFDSQVNLTKLTIPSNVHIIGATAFLGCTRFKEVHFKGTTPPTINSSTSFQAFTGGIVYVPAGCLDAYLSATNYPSSTTNTYIEE